MIIRREEEKDYNSVKKTVRSAFYQKGADDRLNEWTLVEKIRKDKGYIPELALVAEDNGAVIGYIMFSRCMIGENESIALAPLAVSPEKQNLGVGTLLVEKGLEEAFFLGYSSVIVLGGEYYKRFGFEPVNSRIHLSDELDGYLYIKTADKKSKNDFSGQVKYCGAFYDESGKLI